jgi:hypothetical protein
MTRVNALVFENRLVKVEFCYETENGYELYEINDISADYFTTEFKELIISKLEERRLKEISDNNRLKKF